jgi:hypothetical protein
MGAFIKLHHRGINEIVSKKWFTGPAKEYDRERNTRLIQRKKVIVRKNKIIDLLVKQTIRKNKKDKELMEGIFVCLLILGNE